ncbi:hypothetical protein VCR8J2_240328 [Vibrio coralliirubri]|nr:hypothetical protein VCR8J2_240328 [Vibrio coralliirubri]
MGYVAEFGSGAMNVSLIRLNLRGDDEKITTTMRHFTLGIIFSCGF